MKKIEKRFNKKRNTVEAYGNICFCNCVCHYCAAYFESQYKADVVRISTEARDA